MEFDSIMSASACPCNANWEHEHWTESYLFLICFKKENCCEATLATVQTLVNKKNPLFYLFKRSLLKFVLLHHWASVRTKDVTFSGRNGRRQNTFRAVPRHPWARYRIHRCSDRPLRWTGTSARGGPCLHTCEHPPCDPERAKAGKKVKWSTVPNYQTQSVGNSSQLAKHKCPTRWQAFININPYA